MSICNGTCPIHRGEWDAEKWAEQQEETRKALEVFGAWLLSDVPDAIELRASIKKINERFATPSSDGGDK